MAVLVVNCGSSSIKYRLYAIAEKKTGNCLAEGMIERIGTPDARSKYKAFTRLPSAGKAFSDTKENIFDGSIPDHEAAIRLVLKTLQDKDVGVVGDISDIKIVGHRVVHGGDAFVKTAVITHQVKEGIQQCCKFAPLHNPVNLLGIEACQKLFPNATQTAVFDTAFHASLPQYSYLYAIPYSLYEKHGIRRYGFHGTSHKYVSGRCTTVCATADKKHEKIIICHLGNGASICAVQNGKSVDTSMGFTPLEGLVMGTRSGDIDAGVIFSLGRLEGMSLDAIDNLLNKHSGFKGITEESGDSLVVEIKALEGNERHRLALTMFNYRVVKYIGSYAAAMGGVDAIVFTGGIGENSAIIREEVCSHLEFLGVSFDKEKNKIRSRDDRFVTLPSSKTSVLVIPTNEEWMIASESLEITMN